MKRRLSLLLAAILAIALLAACTPAANEPTGSAPSTESGSTATAATKEDTPAKDTVTVISSSRAESLSPTVDLGRCGLTAQALYSTLLAFDNKANVIPNLAERWEEDSESVTVYLRQDVYFHNGDQMTADDIIYTYDLYANAPALAAVMFQNLSTYEKVDDFTVRFYKTAVYSNLLVQLAMNSAIVPMNYHQSVGAEGFEKAPVGAGPYRFVSKDIADVVTLEAFDGFVGEKPGFKHAVIRPSQDPASAIIALEAGEVDFVANVPAPQAAVAMKDSSLKVIEADAYYNMTVAYYGEPFISDLNLRKAIFHAINPDNAVMLATEGAAKPGTDMFAAATMGDLAGTLENYVGYDEALAKEYLAKSGYNGEEYTISIYANPAFAESVQADLNRVGIKVGIEQLDINGWMARYINGELNFTASSSGGIIFSLETTMATFAHAVEASNAGTILYDQEFEDLVAQMSKATDRDTQRELARQVHQRMYDLAMYTPVYDPILYCAHSSGIEYDFAVSPSINIYYVYKMKPA